MVFLFPFVLCAQSFVTPQQFGAKADGKHDDTKAIQKALDSSHSVFSPAGIYITTSSLIVRSNTTLWGEGRESRIRNIVETGYGKNVVVCGHIGSGNNGDSPNVLEKYLATISEDRRAVVLSKSSDCVAGDLVLITSGAIGIKNPSYSYVAKVLSIKGKKTLLLSEFVSNPFLKGQVTVQILKNFPNEKFVAENVCIHDLSIEQEKDSGSGMYVLLLSCYRSSFYNLWLKGNTCIGSNMTVKTTFSNIECVFDGGAIDSPEYFIESKYSNLSGYRYGSRMNQIGISILHGYAGVIENCDIDFGNNGKVGVLEQINPVVTGNRFRNLASHGGGIQGSKYGRSLISHNVLTSLSSSPVIELYGAENVFTDNWIETSTSRWLSFSQNVDFTVNDLSGNHIIGLNRKDALYQSLPFGEISSLASYSKPATITIKPGEKVAVFNPEDNGNDRLAKMTTVTVYFNNGTNARASQEGGGVAFSFSSSTLRIILTQDYILYSAGERNLRVTRKGDGPIVVTNLGKENLVYTLTTVTQE